jgi:alpha-amylase/alpha-mannosidase (GH57 family)
VEDRAVVEGGSTVTVVRVAILWHMHQPLYRSPRDGTFVLPWVRLHALKDYLGMVRLLDEFPAVRITFNLVPALLDQIEAYADGTADEPLHRLSLKPSATLDDDERVLALHGLFRANEKNVLGRFPRLIELFKKRGPAGDEGALREAAARFSTQDFLDLQVLAKLAWFDLDWQRRDAVLRELAEKGRGFNEEDKARLAERESALLRAIIPSYREAAERGQIEISTSPYYHPILPLLCDTEAHHEACPGAPLPRRYRHPEDALDQIRRAVARHAEIFGAPPAGIWPPEGAVSEDAAEVIARAGIRWAASDESVLARSTDRPLHRDSRGTVYPIDHLYRPWVRRTAAGDLVFLFRDRALADLIGFSYAALEPEKAAQDLLARLFRISETWTRQALPGQPVVAIVSDGENAWEHFKDGGRDFLRILYGALSEEKHLEAVTMRAGAETAEPVELPRVFAGSWINANFSVWIGHEDDRRAWDALGNAREAIERNAAQAPPEARERAWESLRAASGSDWCWWYGEDQAPDSEMEFDRLYRHHLRDVYAALGAPAPESLNAPLITTRCAEVRHSRPTGVLAPILDGRIGSPDEWIAAGVYRPPLLAGARHWGGCSVAVVRFGVGDEHLHLLFETPEPARALLADAQLHVSFPGPTTLRYRVGSTSSGVEVNRETATRMGWVGLPTQARAAADQVIECSVPLAELRPEPGRHVAFRVLVVRGETEIERHPEVEPISFEIEEVTRD